MQSIVPMEIILARHGKPKVSQRQWIASRELADWIRAYDEGGVCIEEVPQYIRARAEHSGWIVSSPLARCVQSAQALSPSRNTVSEAVFGEAGLPYALWNFPRLPVAVWIVLFRAAWFCGYSANSESLIVAGGRARTAARRLIELAEQHQSVFLVGHGIMMALIARELIVQGWVGPKRPAHRYWQFSVYRKDEE